LRIIPIFNLKPGAVACIALFATLFAHSHRTVPAQREPSIGVLTNALEVVGNEVSILVVTENRSLSNSALLFKGARIDFEFGVKGKLGCGYFLPVYALEKPFLKIRVNAYVENSLKSLVWCLRSVKPRFRQDAGDGMFFVECRIENGANAVSRN